MNDNGLFDRPRPLCPACGQPCEVVYRDDSFSHEFGVEWVWTPISDCCKDEMVTGGNDKGCPLWHL
jgi:hypothetical protein